MATEEFYQRLYTSLVKTQRRRGQTEEDAEDLAQQAITNIYADMQAHPEKYPDEEAFTRKAHTAARNLLATLANRDAMMNRRHVPIKNEDVFTHAANPSAESDYLRRHQRQNLKEAMDEIPEKTRDMLERMANGESITDIAETTNMPRGTAGKAVFSARKKLSRFLKGHE